MKKEAAKTMAERIAAAAGSDGPYDISRKLERIGVSVSPQSIYAWLEGGDIKEANLVALARIYDVTPAWLRYGIGDEEKMSSTAAAGGQLIDRMPDELLQETIDFIGYKLSRPDVQVAEETRADYFRFVENVRRDMAHKKRKP